MEGVDSFWAAYWGAEVVDWDCYWAGYLPPLRKAKTSSFITLPALPVPTISLRLRLCSLTMALTAGVANLPSPDEALDCCWVAVED